MCDLGRWQPNFVLNLVYPEGFAAEDDGGLKFIPGSHLWRDPGGLRAQTDEDLESGWLEGKLHPVTRQPLQIVRPALGPGSMVCVLSHGAHAVSPKRYGRTRRSSDVLPFLFLNGPILPR